MLNRYFCTHDWVNFSTSSATKSVQQGMEFSAGMLGIPGSNPIGLRSAMRQMRSGNVDGERPKFVLTLCMSACDDDGP